jgi:hypothetical protein
VPLLLLLLLLLPGRMYPPFTTLPQLSVTRAP